MACPELKPDPHRGQCEERQDEARDLVRLVRNDRLFQEAVSSTDPEEVAKLSNQADEILWEDLPTIPLYAKPTLLPHRDTILNVIDNSSTFGPLWNGYALGVKKN